MTQSSRFRVKTLLLLMTALAALLTVGRASGYWVSFGLAISIAAINWAVRSRRRAWWIPTRICIGLAALTATWFLAVDWSSFLEYCEDCHARTDVYQYRVFGFPVTSINEHHPTIQSLVLKDLGAPCPHLHYDREQLHRLWGLTFCACPCFRGTIGLISDWEEYEKRIAPQIRLRGQADPQFAMDLRHRLIDRDDYWYLWDALLTDLCAPLWMEDDCSAEALSWLKGSTKTDYRALNYSITTEESIKWVESAYRVGAVAVYAADILPLEAYIIPRGVRSAQRRVNRVLLKLPTDKNDRAQVLEWIGKQYQTLEERPGDYGQQFVNFHANDELTSNDIAEE